MGVRDVIFYSEELSNYYSSLGEDDAPLHRSQGAPPATPPNCGHDELFYFSNVTDKEVFEIFEAAITVDLAVRDTHV
jgi:hypothetical protein